MILQWNGMELEPRSERALFWARESTLFVADVHLGKEAVFRAGGIPVPEGPGLDDTHRMLALLEATRARRLVVLGDLLHGMESWTPSVLRTIELWSEACQVMVVEGNHDLRAGRGPEPGPGLALGPEVGASGGGDLQWVEPGTRLGPLALLHVPRAESRPGSVRPTARPPALAGHVHPVVRLRGPGGDRMRCPCFQVQPDQIILPAFGTFTGGHPVRPGPRDRILVTAPDPSLGVVEVG